MEHATSIKGQHAVLGMDIVSFSVLPDRAQIDAIQQLLAWVQAALAFYRIQPDDFRWSPAGDGGYLTFKSALACERALDVAFKILEQSQDRIDSHTPGILLRFGLHAGAVHEAEELGRGTNVWGDGINIAARIVSICANSQVLVSEPYYDSYIKRKREDAFHFERQPFSRTVKHGVQVAVRNCWRGDLGLNDVQGGAQRWDSIRALWGKLRREYEFLINDAMHSDDVIAALAAAKFLLHLSDGPGAADDLFESISELGEHKRQEYPRRKHMIFSAMSPEELKGLIGEATPRIFSKGEVICEEGQPSKSSFFPVSGTIVVEGTQLAEPVPIPLGAIVGEFALWIPDIPRTARLRALEDGMLLEVEYTAFRKIAERRPSMADGIYAIIKRRILDNVVKCPDFFPKLGKDELVALRTVAICDKYPAGWRLDLKDTAHILFNGKVRLTPKDAAPFEIATSGRFGPETVVGIVTKLGCPDGEKAEVLDETVTISIPHASLLHLQELSPVVRDAWFAIWGRRQGVIHTKRPDEMRQMA